MRGTPSRLINWLNLCSITFAMSGPAPVIAPALSPDEWLRLLKELEHFAASELQQHRWRGLLGGVPPDGFDAPSLASEVIAEHLTALHNGEPSAHHVLDPSRLKHRLQRRLWRAVNRLRQRKENRVLNNEPDLSPLILPDGDTINPVEACLSDDLAPDELLIQKEDIRIRSELQQQFLSSLNGDPPLQHFYQKLLNVEAQPRSQYEPLTLSWRAVDNFRKRLRRRLHRFTTLPS